MASRMSTPLHAGLKWITALIGRWPGRESGEAGYFNFPTQGSDLNGLSRRG